MRFSCLRQLFCACAFAIGVIAPTANRADEPATRRPNILVILADDLGWGSLACCGAEGLKTPNIDRLAREGRRFTSAYAPGSVCSPTRYGLMTGRYYWRTSVKDGEVLLPDGPLHIEPDRPTLASLCKGQGYRTAAFGKWHLGLQAGVATTDWNRPLTPGPRTLGFDHFYGLAANPNNGPHGFIENEALLGRVPGTSVVVTPEGTSGLEQPFAVDHIMENLTAKATDWIEANREEPFFVYFAANAVHGPIAPNPRFNASRYGPYGDFIEELDWSVGQLLDTLDRLKIADDTLVVFTSDNGGIADPDSRNVAGAIEAGLAVNGPLRAGKHSIYEGGFREPFLVRWPGHVPAGTVSEQVIGLVDVFATLADILGVGRPPRGAEDSVSVLRAFTEAKPGPPVRDHVVMQGADATYALRMGDWKLIERVGAPPFEPRPRKKAPKHAPDAPRQDELFNLRDDPSEQFNLAADHPDRVAEMKRVLSAVRDRGATRPPNVLVILADDLGYGELTCQGYTRDVATPHIDSLAANGVRFTSGYVSGPYCSPTRAGLLTGRYQQRFGHEFNPSVASRTPPTVGLPVSERTLGDRFQAAGYATGWFGKSHLGYAPPFHPCRRGFGEFFGFLGGMHDFLDAAKDPTNPILRGTTPVSQLDYTTDAFGREAAEFIGRNAAQPWLCYLAFNAVHAPLQATPERLERLAAISDPKRRTFAAMLSAMDDAIGTVLATVRERRLENDTLIVFLSDNGGPTPSITSGNGPLRGFKSQTWEGGIRVPFLMQWKGRIPAGGVEDRPVIQLDILPTALAAAGIPLPADAAIDGVNLLPYVTGQTDRDPHEALYWRFGPQLALRQGDWKLVKAPGGGVEGDPRDGRANTRDAELYNLHDDIGETRNLAAKHPEKVRELVAAWERIDTGMIDPLWFDGAAERGTASP